MLKRLSKILPYTFLAPIFGAAAGFISIVVFAVFFSARKEDILAFDLIYRVLLGVAFFCIPLLITLSAICMRRATVNNEKYAVWGIVIGIFPSLYAGFIFLLFVLPVIGLIFYLP